MMSNRAHQISSLKEKLRIKRKQESDNPFPSLYKPVEATKEFTFNSSKNKSYGEHIPAIFDSRDMQSYCKNASIHHESQPNEDRDMNKSHDMRNNKTERLSDSLFTVNRYQRTGGGYNRSILLHMISVNMKMK